MQLLVGVLQVFTLEVSTVIDNIRTWMLCQSFFQMALCSFVCRLDELNLSWCNFTGAHVKAAVNHVTSKVTQLNLSGYRQNLQMQGK